MNTFNPFIFSDRDEFKDVKKELSVYFTQEHFEKYPNDYFLISNMLESNHLLQFSNLESAKKFAEIRFGKNIYCFDHEKLFFTQFEEKEGQEMSDTHLIVPSSTLIFLHEKVLENLDSSISNIENVERLSFDFISDEITRNITDVEYRTFQTNLKLLKQFLVGMTYSVPSSLEVFSKNTLKHSLSDEEILRNEANVRKTIFEPSYLSSTQFTSFNSSKFDDDIQVELLRFQKILLEKTFIQYSSPLVAKKFNLSPKSQKSLIGNVLLNTSMTTKIEDAIAIFENIVDSTDLSSKKKDSLLANFLLHPLNKDGSKSLMGNYLQALFSSSINRSKIIEYIADNAIMFNRQDIKKIKKKPYSKNQNYNLKEFTDILPEKIYNEVLEIIKTKDPSVFDTIQTLNKDNENLTAQLFTDNEINVSHYFPKQKEVYLRLSTEKLIKFTNSNDSVENFNGVLEEIFEQLAKIDNQQSEHYRFRDKSVNFILFSDEENSSLIQDSQTLLSLMLKAVTYVYDYQKTHQNNISTHYVTDGSKHAVKEVYSQYRQQLLSEELTSINNLKEKKSITKI